MPYRLKSGESVPQGIRRIAREEIESALVLLNRAGAQGRDEAIHEARKCVKKLRALLRLVRPALGTIYQAEDRYFQTAARRLSRYRDNQAVIEILGNLPQKYKSELKDDILEPIFRGLLKRKHGREYSGAADRAVKRISASLRAARTRLEKWPIREDGFEAIAPGFTATYRKGRKAMAMVAQLASPEDCHRWRKRVKDHLYHVRLLENPWANSLKEYERSLSHLDTSLGDHQNLQVLRDRLRATPNAFGEKAGVDVCLDLLGRYQDELRKKALSLGERIYAEKPKSLQKHVQHLWDSWQSQPKHRKPAHSQNGLGKIGKKSERRAAQL